MTMQKERALWIAIGLASVTFSETKKKTAENVCVFIGGSKRRVVKVRCVDPIFYAFPIVDDIYLIAIYSNNQWNIQRKPKII